MKEILTEKEFEKQKAIIHEIFNRYNHREDIVEALNSQHYDYMCEVTRDEHIYGIDKSDEDYNFQILVYLNFIDGDYHIYKRTDCEHM